MSRIRIQFRFLIKVFVAFAVLGVALFFLHRFQVSRQVDALLDRARAAAKADDLSKASRYYSQYMAVKKDAVEPCVELAELLQKANSHERACFFFEKALRIDPSLLSAREAIVESSMEIGRFSDAKTHLTEKLIPSAPENADFLWRLGVCEENLGNFPAARDSMAKAFNLEPSRPEYAASLAELLTTRFNSPNDARVQVLDKLVASAPEDPRVYVARGNWLMRQRNKLSSSSGAIREQFGDAAWQDAQSALEKAPDDPIAAPFFALLALEKKESDRARNALQKAIESHPELPSLYLLLAQIEATEQKADAATAILKKGLESDRIKEKDKIELLWSLCQMYLDLGNLTEVEALEPRLRENFQESMLELVSARKLFVERKWREAADKFDKVRSQLGKANDLIKQADFLLAICYRNLENFDQEVAALKRCLNVDPSWTPARQALAGAYRRMNKTQDSLTEMRQLLTQPEVSADALYNYAYVLFADGIKRKAKGDDWRELRAVLDKLDQFPETSDAATELRALLLSREGKADEAESLVRSKLEANKNSTVLYQALLSLQLESKDWEKVRLTLKEAGETLGDTAGLRLARANFLIQRDGDQVDMQQLDQIATPKDEWSEEDKSRLANEAAILFLQIGDFERATQYAKKAANSKFGETNLNVHLILFDLASKREDEKLMAESLERVEAIENGPLLRVGRAIQELAKVRKRQKNPTGDQAADTQFVSEGRKNALQLLNSAATSRPTWPRIPRLKGEILEDEGKDDAAIEAYMQAISLEDPNNPNIELKTRALYLLYRNRRYAEADGLVRQILESEERGLISDALRRVSADISLEVADYERAIDLMLESASKSDDPKDHVFLAKVYDLKGDKGKAEEEYRVAIAKDPTAPGPWILLIRFLGESGNSEAIEVALAEAESQLSDDMRDDTIAQAYETLGNPNKAAEYYQKALDKAPNNAAAMRHYANFILRTAQPQNAGPLLEKLAEPDTKAKESDRAWARRNLAILASIMNRTTAQTSGLSKAREWLEDNRKEFGRSDEDDRALAQALMSRPDASELELNEAIQKLEQLIKPPAEFNLDDNFRLASVYKQLATIYAARGDEENLRFARTRYTRTMRSVMGNGGADNAQVVRAHAQALIDLKETSEAQIWLERLKSLTKDELAKVAVESQILINSGSYPKLLELLLSSSKNLTDTDGTVNGTIAQISEIVAKKLVVENRQDDAKPFSDLAEKLFAEVSKNPQKNLALAAYFARSGAIDQFLKEIDGKPTTSEQFGEIVQSAIQAPQLTPEEAKSVIPSIEGMLEKDPQNVLLLMALGDYCSWAGDIEKAKSAYQRTLKENENFVPALNNLAMVLASSEKNVNEAVEAIDRAVASAGEKDYLLDTRGIVRLAAGDTKGAEADLRRCIEMSSRADRHFHLALVLLAQGRKEEALQSLAEAEKGGLKLDALHPIERNAYEKLIRAK